MNNEVWNFNLHATIDKYEDNTPHYPGVPGGGFYPDSRFYRKDKPVVSLRNNGRKYRERTLKNATII